MRLSNNINGAWGALATGRGFALGCRYARDHFPDEFGRRRTYWPRPGRNFLRSLLSTAASRRGPWLAKCSLPRISVHWDLRKSCFAIYLDLPVLMNRIHPKLLIRHNRHSNTCGMDVRSIFVTGDSRVYVYYIGACDRMANHTRPQHITTRHTTYATLRAIEYFECFLVETIAKKLLVCIPTIRPKENRAKHWQGQPIDRSPNLPSHPPRKQDLSWCILPHPNYPHRHIQMHRRETR